MISNSNRPVGSSISFDQAYLLPLMSGFASYALEVVHVNVLASCYRSGGLSNDFSVFVYAMPFWHVGDSEFVSELDSLFCSDFKSVVTCFDSD